MADEQPQLLVYLGSCTLEGGKPGELWATETMARPCATVDELRKTASPFGKRRTSYTVGAIYEGRADIGDDGRPTVITRAFSYRSMLDTEAVSALVLYEKALASAEAAKKAEAKARKDGGESLDSLLDQVARIVSRAPFEQQSKIIQGFTADVQRRALAIWRKSR